MKTKMKIIELCILDVTEQLVFDKFHNLITSVLFNVFGSFF